MINKLADTYCESCVQSVLLVAAFGFLACLTAGLGVITPDAEQSDVENRSLQRLPSLPKGIWEIQGFVQGLDRYAVDQSGFRNQFVEWRNRLRFQLFGIIQADRCIVGKDKWLFLERRSTAQFSNVDVISGEWTGRDQATSPWIPFLKDQSDWLDRRGIRFIVAFIPNKYSIYPEQLPDGLTADSEAVPYLPIIHGVEGHPNLRVVDLRDALVGAKSWSLLYSPSDYHWNGRGAYIGLQEISKAIQDWFPNMATPSEDQFILTVENLDLAQNYQKPGLGLARTTSMPELFPSTWYGVEPKNPQAIEVDPPSSTHSLTSSNVRTPKAYESDSATGPHILYIGDSYRWQLSALFAEQVERVVYVDTRESFFDRSLIESENPEVVLFSAHGYFFTRNVDPYSIVDRQNQARASESNAASDKEDLNLIL